MNWVIDSGFIRGEQGRSQLKRESESGGWDQWLAGSMAGGEMISATTKIPFLGVSIVILVNYCALLVNEWRLDLCHKENRT